jgi:hypothetical protein
MRQEHLQGMPLDVSTAKNTYRHVHAQKAAEHRDNACMRTHPARCWGQAEGGVGNAVVVAGAVPCAPCGSGRCVVQTLARHDVCRTQQHSEVSSLAATYHCAY